MKSRILGALLLAGSAPLMAQQGVALVQTPATPPEAQQDTVPEAGQVTPQTGTANAKKENEKVCKVVPVTGSRFKRRLCYTQHEWDAIDRAHRDKMREIDSQPIRQRSEGG